MAQYATAARGVAERHHVEILDFWGLGAEHVVSTLLEDGLHFNKQGHSEQAQLLLQLVGSLDFYRRHWSKWDTAE